MGHPLYRKLTIWLF